MFIAPILVLYLLALLIIANNQYDKVVEIARTKNAGIEPEVVNRLDSEKGAGFGGKFIFRPPISIIIESRHSELARAIKRHNKVIKLFWASSLILVPAAVILMRFIDK